MDRAWLSSISIFPYLSSCAICLYGFSRRWKKWRPKLQLLEALAQLVLSECRCSSMARSDELVGLATGV